MWGFFLHIADAATVHKVLKNLDVVKASGRDQISVKCFKDVLKCFNSYSSC